MRCCVVNCKNYNINYQVDQQGITFHKFPKDNASSKAWLKAIKHINTDFDDRLICSDHFKDEDYCFRNGVRELRNGAIPFSDQEKSTTAIKMCRICLVRNVKMYSIKRHGLSKMYQELTGIDVKCKDNYPQHICWECDARLKASVAFKQKALRADFHMRTIFDNNKDSTLADLKCINRHTCRLKTTLMHTYLDNSVVEDHELCKYEIHLIDDVGHNTPDELDVEDEHNSKIERDVNDVLDTKGENFIKNVIDVKLYTQEVNDTRDTEDVQSSDDLQELFNTEDKTVSANFDEPVEYYISDSDGSSIFDTQDNNETYNTENLLGSDNLQKSEMEHDTVNVSSDESHKNITDSDDELRLVVDKKVETKIVRRGKAVKRRAGVHKVVEKAKTLKYRPPVQIKLDENMFTIIKTTPEEQIAEIERRKESASYAVAPFKCTVCYRVFSRKAKHDAHFVRHTDKKGTFTCYICKTRMKTERALKSHLTSLHTQKFICNLCPFVSKSRSFALHHEQFHNGIKYQCSLCDANFPKISTYNSHMRIKHVSNFVCELCGNTFINEKGVEIHKKIAHHLTTKTLKSQQVLEGPYCEACDVKFLSAEAYETHFKFTSKHNTDIQRRSSGSNWDYVCQLCGLSFQTSKGFTEHNKGKHPSGETVPADGPYCEDCHIRFVNEEALSKHIKMSAKHSVNKSWIVNSKSWLQKKREGARSNQPIPCEQCGVLLKNSRAYNGHFRSEHRDKNRTKYLTGKAPCMCEVCGRIFPCFAVLRDHSWVHTDEKPFDCDTCGKAFQTRQTLTLHRRMHSQVTHECSVCGKHFYSQGNKRRHMTIHTGLKPHKCDMCEKVFSTKSEKQNHIKHVHFKKPWPKKNKAATKRRRKQKTPKTESEDDDGDEIHDD